MKLKINGRIVELYDGAISDLPMCRLHKFNKLTLAEAGIGDDLNALDAKLHRILSLIKTDKEAAAKEVALLRQTIQFAADGISLKSLAFMTLVKSIDGRPFTDISDEGLREASKMLNEERKSVIGAAIDAVKKKLYPK